MKVSSVLGVGCWVGLSVVFVVVGVPKIGFPVVASIGMYTPRLSFFTGQPSYFGCAGHFLEFVSRVPIGHMCCIV